MYPTRLKDPQATLDYAWNFRKADDPYLEDDETIIQQSIAVSPDDGSMSVQSSTIVSGDRVVAWLTGGTAGADYIVTATITTSAGRIDDRSIRILCRQR